MEWRRRKAAMSRAAGGGQADFKEKPDECHGLGRGRSSALLSVLRGTRMSHRFGYVPCLHPPASGSTAWDTRRVFLRPYLDRSPWLERMMCSLLVTRIITGSSTRYRAQRSILDAEGTCAASKNVMKIYDVSQLDVSIIPCLGQPLATALF